MFNILKQKSLKNFAIIFFLGISSGLPLALILSTLKALMVDQGFDLKTIGFFSLVTLPYSIKFLFAPVIDSCKVPFLSNLIGQRKSWIMISQLFLALFVAGLGTAGLSGSLTAIATFAVLLAFASASQDIVIDGYRIELIEKDEQGLAASFYVYGYRIGMLISGAGALILADIMGWNVVYYIMAAIMLSAVIITLCATETRENFQTKGHDFLSWFTFSVIDPLTDFAKHPMWFVILIFVILFKLGDAFAGNLTLPFLLDIGFTKIEIASIVKTFGLFATLIGVFAGGLMIKKTGIIKSLWIAGTLQMLSNLAFAYLAHIGYNQNALYLVIFTENFSGGIGDAVFIAYLSSLCTVAFSATQYALLVSFATMARSFLTSTAGIFAENLGWYEFFILSTLVALPSLILLYFISEKPKKI